MIIASVDTTSQSFALGQVSAVLAVAGVAVMLLWRFTRSWRMPSTPPGGDPAGTLREERRRRRFVVGVTVLIALGAAARAATSYAPEPRASEARATAAAAAGQGAQAGEPPKVVLPESFAGFHLMTGAAAERTQAAVLAGRTLPAGTKAGFYAHDGDENLDLLVVVRSAEWDPTIHEDKARNSIAQEFRDYFAGAKARDVTAFEPGPYGGGLSCGLAQGADGERAVCAWSDATTFGSVRLARASTLAEAAQTALALRNAAMH
ncbi:hypothetical protein ACWFQ8_17200 [Streptomyces sp. NPDC055254]